MVFFEQCRESFSDKIQVIGLTVYDMNHCTEKRRLAARDQTMLFQYHPEKVQLVNYYLFLLHTPYALNSSLFSHKRQHFTCIVEDMNRNLTGN